jgi:hypothetical protein
LLGALLEFLFEQQDFLAKEFLFFRPLLLLLRRGLGIYNIWIILPILLKFESPGSFSNK